MKALKVKYGRSFIGRFQHDSELLGELKDFVARERIQSGVFSIMGAVKNAELSFYDQEKKVYVNKIYRKPLEIVYCFGNITKRGNEALIHAHAGFSDRYGHMFGGHLLSAKVFAGEFYIREFKNKLSRTYDSVTGLKLFDL